MEFVTSLPPAVGSRIRAELNDLKRTPQACADEIGWKVEDLEDVLAGRAEDARVVAVIEAILRNYPVSPQSFTASWDDTDEGVLYMSRRSSLESQRIFDRTSASGHRTPYYEYRDTAMSRLNGLRPEWIRPLRYTPNPDTDNKDVVLNNGHLLHQVTFFSNNVNFYYECDDQVQGVEMNWGDSNYIAPFVPHSFTSRDPELEAFIVAITFPGPVKKALNSPVLASAGAWQRSMQRELAPGSDGENDFLDRRFVTLVEDIGEMLEASNSQDTEEGASESGLGVSRARLRCGNEGSVRLRTGRDESLLLNAGSNRQGLKIHQLARPPSYLETTVLRLEFCDDRPNADDLPLAQFTTYRGVYVYCLGPSVEITWVGTEGLRKRNLVSGDSVFVKPFVPFTFSGSVGSELISVAVPGDVTQTTLLDLCHHNDVDRAIVETRSWFD